MRKLLLALAALAAAAIAVPLGFGSSHREAPSISLDPSADNTDTYAWTAKDAPGALTVAADWIPGEVPANGPNFIRFDDRARYYIHVDNTGDGRPDVSYRYQFKTQVTQQELVPVRAPGRERIRRPEAERGPALLDRTRESRYHGKQAGQVHAKTHRARPAGGAAEHRPEDVPELRHVRGRGDHARSSDGTKVFVGQRDDPFFVDLGATFDGLNVRKLTGNQGEGKDDLSGINIHSIVMQIPERLVHARTASPSRARTPATPSWACGPPPSAGGSQVTGTPRRRRKHHRPAVEAAGCRSRGSATRWSTRSSSRSARRTSSTAPPRTVTPRSTASTS